MNNTKVHRYYYGYVIVAACFGIQAIGVGTYVSYGVFFNSLASEFGWSRAAISGASSIAFFMMGLLGIFAGRLNDKIGPKNVMAFTGFLFGLGHVLMSRLSTVWQLYIFYSFIIGIGLSSVDVIALSTTARWFVKKRGIMTGIVKIGTGAGQLIMPLAASILISKYGWRASYNIIGLTVLVSLVAISQLLKRNPAQIDLSDNYNGKTSRGSQRPYAEGFYLNEALRTKQFWAICSTNLTIVFCFLIIILHIVPYAQDTGFSATKAATVLSTIGGVSMIGRFIIGFTIDQIGSKRSMILCIILLIAGLFLLQIAKGLWVLYLFAVIYGISHGGYFTAMSPIVAEFFGITAHGVLFGIVAFSGTVGGAIGPILAGYIFDVTAGYSLAFWLCIVMASLGLLLLTLLKPIEKVAWKEI
jgi:MFS family permease